MTIANTARRAQFPGNGSNTSFPFVFVCYAKTHLVVVKRSTANVDTTLVLDSDYSVALNLDGTPGGTITYPLIGSALAVGEYLTVVSNQPAEQDTNLTNAGAFFADTVEGMSDYLTILEQQNAEAISRTPKFPISDNLTASDLPPKANRAGKFRAWDANGQETQASGTGNDSALRTDLANAVAGADGSRLVGFRRTETGAVARSVFLALSTIVSAKDFGVVGDGATDDTVALQAAVTAAANKTLFIPDGTYKVTSAIALPSNITIRAAAPGAATIRQYTANTNCVTANGKTNIKIFGLKVYAVGSMSSYTNGCGFYFDTCTYCDVVDSIVENHRGYGVMYVNSNHNQVRFCRFINSPVINSDNHTQCAGDITFSYGSSYNTAFANECISGNGVGVQIQSITAGDVCSYNLVEANIITDCKIYGVNVYALNNFTDTVRGNMVVNNKIKNITGAVQHQTNGYVFGAGVYCVAVDDTTVNNNNIQGTHTAAVVFVDQLAPGGIGFTSCGKMTAIGNTLKTCGMHGITVRDPSAIGSARQRTLVKNNNISDVTLIGIQVKEKANISVQNNDVDTTGGHGIHVDNTTTKRKGVKVDGNDVRNVTGTGILVTYCAGVSVNGNTSDTTTVHGIYVQNCDDLVLNGSDVLAHTTYGIAVDTVTRYSMAGNNINGTGTSTYGYGLLSRATGTGTIDPSSNTVANCVTAFIGDYIPFYAAAPTTGTWAKGDFVHDITAGSAGYARRVCTVAGTPGTWKQEGLIT